MKINKRFIFYVALVIGIWWVTNLYLNLLGPLVIGSILAYLLYPLVTFLKTKGGLSHQLATNIVFILFSIILITTVSALSPTVIRQSNALNSAAPALINRISALQPRVEQISGMNVPLDDFIIEFEKDLEQLLRPDRLYRLILTTTSNFIYVVITFVISYYLLKDWEKFRASIIGLFPQKLHDDFATLLIDLDLIWKNYLRGQLSLMLFIGITSGISSYLIGLRSALLIGIIAGVMELIPSIGPTVTTILATSTAWIFGSTHLQLSNFRFAVLVCGIFIAIQIVEGLWIQPRIISKRMNLHPGLVLIAIASTVFTLGIIAGLIVIPIIGSLELIIKFTNKQLSE